MPSFIWKERAISRAVMCALHPEASKDLSLMLANAGLKAWKKIEEIHRSGKKEEEEKTFFFKQHLGPEVHWFFVQASQALEAELYLPACTSFLNGIEMSIRMTMTQIKSSDRRVSNSVDLGKTMGNKLLRCSKEEGLPIDALAFPGERNFLENLKTQEDVMVVRIRHNLCHGNILEYINSELGEGREFFTPECCRELAHILYEISKKWAIELGQFRAKNRLG